MAPRRIPYARTGGERRTSQVSRADSFPERNQRKLAPSLLDPYLAYLEERHRKGCENASQLWREICKQGYPGSRSQVYKWMHP